MPILVQLLHACRGTKFNKDRTKQKPCGSTAVMMVPILLNNDAGGFDLGVAVPAGWIDNDACSRECSLSMSPVAGEGGLIVAPGKRGGN